jgi:hypothetical protein
MCDFDVVCCVPAVVWCMLCDVCCVSGDIILMLAIILLRTSGAYTPVVRYSHRAVGNDQ